MTKDCCLTIETRTAQSEAVITETKARYCRKGGRHHILFDIEGDRCRIGFDDNSLLYKRTGVLSYELSLISGKTTDAEMSTPYGRTGITCTTRKYEIRTERDGFIIETDYDIADERYEMKIRLS
ncbi:MAG: DUF1934 domain-containing protein [Lachnospiraceae bacterium]|nr:DUF1934 domain-containing protein [Lachnospiraceae bacterium]